MVATKQYMDKIILGDLNLVLRTSADDPKVKNSIETLAQKNWPTYSFNASLPFEAACGKVWEDIYDYWPSLQIGFFDSTSGEILAGVNSLALEWNQDASHLPETGWDWAMIQGVNQNGIAKPNTLIALAAAVEQRVRNSKISEFLLLTLKDIAKKNLYKQLYAPVAPTKKASYPNIPINEYLTWKSENGCTFDPWIRMHLKIGGSIIKPCHQSMTFSGRVKEWEEWTKLKFPVTQNYVVPQMMSLLHIDRDKDEGVYIEPNVWVEHSLLNSAIT